MNKEASYRRSHLTILHQKNNPIHLLCDSGKTHFVAWAKSDDIWPEQQTYPDELWAFFSPASLTDCWRASLTDCWRANTGGNNVRWLCLVLRASRTVEEQIHEEIIYVDYV
jgi:hypothetical protein